MGKNRNEKLVSDEKIQLFFSFKKCCKRKKRLKKKIKLIN